MAATQLLGFRFAYQREFRLRESRMWQMTASILSPLIAATGLAFGYFQWRKAQLRRDDVLAWANEVIESLEALLLVCLLEDPPLDQDTARSKSLDIAFRTATLVE